MFFLFLFIYLLVFVGGVGYLFWRTYAEEELLVKDYGVGLFGPIKVYRKRYGEVRLRMCNVVQGIDARTFVNDYSYWHKTAELILAHKEKVQRSEFRVLYLGLGAGTIPMLVAQKDKLISQEIIEIDPKMIEVVTQNFGLGDVTSIHVRAADAFALVTGRYDFGCRFDVVQVDVFSDFDSLDTPKSIDSGFFDYYVSLISSGGLLIVNQPNHTLPAEESRRKLEELLKAKYAGVSTYFVDDRKRDFKNAILVVQFPYTLMI